jgi:hypothetical protein
MLSTGRAGRPQATVLPTGVTARDSVPEIVVATRNALYRKGKPQISARDSPFTLVIILVQWFLTFIHNLLIDACDRRYTPDIGRR